MVFICVLFYPAIPTSIFNFIQLFLYLFLFFFYILSIIYKCHLIIRWEVSKFVATPLINLRLFRRPMRLLLIIHLGLLTAISTNPAKACPKRSQRKVWRYSHANFESACEYLAAVDWESLFLSGDVNICWSNSEEVGHDHVRTKSGRVAPYITLYKL